ncbi:unnamed protein product [Acanthosepion pharaonis]|uniref:Uncharacterized protein n=1 Tax=Acanthosepion pharaonis TaxID=158019 RepID=A0A812C784_ACAPH|nr:unnamed protein product [Sepia pharaonis]
MLPYYFFLSSRFYPLWLPHEHIFSISIFFLAIVVYGNDDDDVESFSTLSLSFFLIQIFFFCYSISFSSSSSCSCLGPLTTFFLLSSFCFLLIFSLSLSLFLSFIHFLSLFLKYKLFSLFFLNLFFLLSTKNSSYFLFFFIKLFTHFLSLSLCFFLFFFIKAFYSFSLSLSLCFFLFFFIKAFYSHALFIYIISLFFFSTSSSSSKYTEIFSPPLKCNVQQHNSLHCPTFFFSLSFTLHPLPTFEISFFSTKPFTVCNSFFISTLLFYLSFLASPFPICDAATFIAHTLLLLPPPPYSSCDINSITGVTPLWPVLTTWIPLKKSGVCTINSYGLVRYLIYFLSCYIFFLLPKYPNYLWNSSISTSFHNLFPLSFIIPFSPSLTWSSAGLHLSVAVHRQFAPIKLLHFLMQYFKDKTY